MSLERDIRRALAVFDDDALATIASKGLLRRAQKDLEAGKVAPPVAADAGLHVACDGETVRIDAAGPRTARCTCTAGGVCRHILAAVLALRAPDEPTGSEPAQTNPILAPGEAASQGGDDAATDAAAEAAVEADTPAATGKVRRKAPSAADELLALDGEAIVRWAGKPALRAALALLGDEPGLLIDARRTRLLLTVDDTEIAFLAGQGLDGMTSKLKGARRKAMHVAAVLAFRRSRGLFDPAAIGAALPHAGAEALPDAALLGRIIAALEAAARSALNHAPLVLADRLLTLSVYARAEALPELAVLLRLIGRRIEEKRERSAGFEPEAVLSLIARTHARACALRDTTDPARCDRLRGAARQTYEQTPPLTLTGLGAALWHSPTGARGVTAWFHVLPLDRILSFAHARPAGQTAGFDAAGAYEREPVWQGAPLSCLMGAQMTLARPKLSAEGRLSSVSEGASPPTPWSGARDTFAGSTVAFADWGDLEARLRERHSGALAEPPQARDALLLLPARHARSRFDALRQLYVWPLADREGRWIALELAHAEAGDVAGGRLQRLAQAADVIAVLVQPTLEGPRFRLKPLSVVARTPAAGEPRVYSLDIETGGLELSGRGLVEHWLAQLATTAQGAPPVAAAFAEPVADDSARRLLLTAQAALLRLAELGLARLDEAEKKRLLLLARQLADAGLLLLAARVKLIEAENARTDAAALLIAWYLTERSLALTRRLPWLQPLAGDGA